MGETPALRVIKKETKDKEERRERIKKKEKKEEREERERKKHTNTNPALRVPPAETRLTVYRWIDIEQEFLLLKE